MNILAEREWILTNKIGGYALGFGNMLNKRKYDGLLISSSETMERIHILSSIEEKVTADNISFFLDSNYYSNCIHPNGYSHIVKAWLRPYPSVLYSSNPYNEDFLIFKELFMLQKKNAVVVKYTNTGVKNIHLTLHPKLSLRNHHFLNNRGIWGYTGLEKKIDGNNMSIRRTDNNYEAHIYTEKGRLIETHIVYDAVYYPIEAMRGYDSTEDLVSPVRIEVWLTPGETVKIIFSSEKIDNVINAGKEAEKYYKQLPVPATAPKDTNPAPLSKYHVPETREFDKDEYIKILKEAAHDFIVGDNDIIAGYPWFGTWGRDTFISMDSLSYLPEGESLAVNILKKYGSYLKGCLLPNLFGEGGRGMNYDSVDAPLWYVIRCSQFAIGDKDLFQKASQIILGFLYEEDHPFHIDEDGLINIREGDHALTWMDAKIYNSPVTPRFGKPVEINALWFNALCSVKKMAQKNRSANLTAGSRSYPLKELDALIQKVKSSFQKFVGDNYLADRIERGNPVWEVRPNAVIALSLPFDIVEADVMKMVWATAREELLTPYGLRTLTPKNPAFKRKYLGNQKQRDLAYHQGTVWTFLLLPFSRLALKVLDHEKRDEGVYKVISGYIWKFRDSFMKGHMASVAEVWDGSDPSLPKGCPAQAWSVFALLGIEGLLSELREEE